MKKKVSQLINSPWIFLVVMILIYSAVAVFDFSLFRVVVSTFERIFWRILPILPLIFGLIFLSNLFLEPKQIKEYLGKESGLKGYLISIVGGIISTGPIYMWYPLLEDFKEKGMRLSLIATFLYNRAIKLPLLPVIIFYFGWSFTLVLTVLMVFFSIVNGILTEKIVVAY